MTTKCQSTASRAQNGGLGLIKLFPKNINYNGLEKREINGH